MILTAIIIIILFCVWLKAITTETFRLRLNSNFFQEGEYLMVEPTFTILQVVRVVHPGKCEYEVVSFCGSRYSCVNKAKKHWYNFVRFCNNY